MLRDEFSVKIEHDNKSGSASSAKVHRSVAARKKEGVDIPKCWEDYVLDDSALYALAGIHIEKYVDASWWKGNRIYILPAGMVQLCFASIITSAADMKQFKTDFAKLLTAVQ